LSIENTTIQYPSTLPARIRWHREQLGWSLGKVPGFSHTTIWKYESGKQTPTPKQRAKLAHVFGVPVELLVDDLASGTDVATPPSSQLHTVQQLLDQGEAPAAYAAGHQASRVAMALGDTEAIFAAERLLRAAVRQMGLADTWREILDKTPRYWQWFGLGDHLFGGYAWNVHTRRNNLSPLRMCRPQTDYSGLRAKSVRARGQHWHPRPSECPRRYSRASRAIE
jgi:transcriptional regulator with XRE-family HTH domain